MDSKDFMGRRSLNIKDSKAAYKKFRTAIAVKKCYENVYNIAIACPQNFTSGRWRIAYGYMDSGVPCLLLRHCFILDDCGRVIDPTIVVARETIQEELGGEKEPWPNYFTMYVFQDIREYIDAFRQEKNMDFRAFLLEYDRKAVAWATETGRILRG